jgi:hypothetical protein
MFSFLFKNNNCAVIQRGCLFMRVSQLWQVRSLGNTVHMVSIFRSLGNTVHMWVSSEAWGTQCTCECLQKLGEHSAHGEYLQREQGRILDACACLSVCAMGPTNMSPEMVFLFWELTELLIECDCTKLGPSAWQVLIQSTFFFLLFIY